MSEWTIPGYTECGELGSGSGGRVVLAVSDAGGDPVAVKYLGGKLRMDSAFADAFRAEARRLAALDSPYLVRLHSCLADPEGLALVMEPVGGISLRTLLRREGATGPEAALVMLRDSLLGLAAVHGAEVVHRSYRPENVLVTVGGAVKLADAGVAVRGSTDPGTVGTPGYLAPEQWGGGPASPASDVYAATVTFHECLTGKRPYAGESAAELAVQHITVPVPEDEAPEPVRALIRRGMAKDPAQRPESTGEFAREVAELAREAYGPGWEERGRRRLVSMVARWPLLLPTAAGDTAGSAAGGAAALTAVAGPTVTVTAAADGGDGTRAADAGSGTGGRRRPGRYGWLAAAAATAVAGVLTVAAVSGGPEQPTAAERPGPADTAAPEATASVTGRSGSPGSPQPQASPGSTGTPRGGASATASPGLGPVRDGGTEVGRSGSISFAPSAPGSGDPTGEAAVTSLSVSDLSSSGLSRAKAAVEVNTSGTGPVTVTVSWHRSSREGTLGSRHGDVQTTVLSGRTHYRLTPEHTFQGLGCYWGVQVTTHPRASRGAASRQIAAPLCDLA